MPSSAASRRIRKNVSSDSIADRFVACYTGAVYDVLRGLGYANQVLPQSILALIPGGKLCGRVFYGGGPSAPRAGLGFYRKHYL